MDYIFVYPIWWRTRKNAKKPGQLYLELLQRQAIQKQREKCIYATSSRTDLLSFQHSGSLAQNASNPVIKTKARLLELEEYGLGKILSLGLTLSLIRRTPKDGPEKIVVFICLNFNLFLYFC